MSYYYEYLKMNGESFFTVVMLPEEGGRFPTVVCRNPYVKACVDADEQALAEEYHRGYHGWLERGYAVVLQHCKGQGKSTGAFVPYVHEREDGLALRAWIREQSFYNGELYLLGGSYTASLHYATAPFEEDVRGAVFTVQDSERYRLWYRNGQMRKGHAAWHFGLYKDKCGLKKDFSKRSFSRLPLAGLSEECLGDRAEDFEQMLDADSPAHEFWSTRFGGADARDAVSDANIPILLATGYNDFYIGGIFRMWERMSERTRAKSALLVSPYNHGDGYYGEDGVSFPMGKRSEAFGGDYQIAWIESVRHGTPIPFERGVITYYRAFGDGWQADFYKTPTEELRLPLGEGTREFVYDPKQPPAFNAEGCYAEELCDRGDVVTLYTDAFERDTLVKGRMKMRLSVSSDRPDTSFYARISLKKQDFAYVLRHDITSLCYQLGDYRIGDKVTLDLCFDEYAFLVKAGERLRIDVSSTDDNAYVCHTNRKGKYYLQTGTDVAKNSIYLDSSCLILPVEREDE